jgi:hypothetical protein
VSDAPAFASATEALAVLESAMGYLAAADPTEMATTEQARCLIVLERVDAVETAARASILAAFTAAQGYACDGQHGTRSWLIHQTCITPGAAVAHTAWPRRGHAHPRVMAAMRGSDLRVGRPDDLRVDGPAAGGVPGRRR